MSGLTLNSIEIPTAKIERSYAHIGAMSRAHSASLVRHDTGIPRVWRLTTSPMTEAEADGATAVLLGLGETWSFDASGDAYEYGSKGRGFVLGSSSTRDTATPSPSFGDASAAVGGGQYIEPNRAIDSAKYTIQVDRNEASGGWERHTRSSAGWELLDGAVATGNQAFWLDLTSAPGRLRLYGKDTSDVNTACNYDQLIIIPEELTQAQSIDLASRLTQASDLPTLLMGGDLVGLSEVAVSADPATLKVAFVHGRDAGAVAALRVLSCDLVEVL